MNSYPYPFKFDSEKALEALLYIVNRTPRPDVYSVLKILYFADKEHLMKYGRFICGDSYVAMRNGPVPSGTYDIVKEVRSGVGNLFLSHALSSLDVKPDHMMTALRDADRDLLSRSDIECLDRSISENGGLSFAQLKDKSHDDAYKAADENDFIAIDKIVSLFPNADLLMEYLYSNDSD